jgi:hypothetical protein
MYLDNISKVLDKAYDANYEILFLGDLNIDWNVRDCPLKARLLSLADTCNLSEVVKTPTRICSRADGVKSSTYIDLIFTNVPIGTFVHRLKRPQPYCYWKKDENTQGRSESSFQTNL